MTNFNTCLTRQTEQKCIVHYAFKVKQCILVQFAKWHCAKQQRTSHIGMKTALPYGTNNKHVDLIIEHHKVRAAYRQVKVNAGQNPQSDESSTDKHSEIPEDDNNEEEVIDGDTQSEEEERTPRRILWSSAQQSNKDKKVRASANKPKKKTVV
jgi:hypothetical protein